MRLGVLFYQQISSYNHIQGGTLGCILSLGPHLFVKVPRPGDSEVSFAVFESSCHLLLPV